jgi:hypothetical protein
MPSHGRGHWFDPSTAHHKISNLEPHNMITVGDLPPTNPVISTSSCHKIPHSL